MSAIPLLVPIHCFHVKNLLLHQASPEFSEAVYILGVERLSELVVFTLVDIVSTLVV